MHYASYNLTECLTKPGTTFHGAPSLSDMLIIYAKMTSDTTTSMVKIRVKFNQWQLNGVIL